MRHFRCLLMVLVWMMACGSVFGHTITPDIAGDVHMNVFQRIRSYMVSTMEKIIHPLLPFYQGMTGVFRSVHPMEFQMSWISLRAVNHTNTPTPAPSRSPSLSYPPTNGPTKTPAPSQAPISTTPATPAMKFISTYAGTGASGSTGDGGLAINCRFYGPSYLAVDNSNGNLYVFDNNRAKIITKSTGIITIAVAGNEGGTVVQVGNGDGGPATSLYTLSTCGLAVDNTNGNLYVSEPNYGRIRMVEKTTGIITTFAGYAGITGDYKQGTTGDGGPATSALLMSPCGLAVDNLYVYFTDPTSGKIRVVTKSTGIIATLAGMWVGTGFGSTGGSTGDGGPATLAQLNYPRAVAVDSVGNVYIADTNNNKVRLVTRSTGIITTYVGTGYGASTGFGGSAGDGGPATSAQLYTPVAIALDNVGNLYISDQANNKIRMVAKTTGIITTFVGTGYGASVGSGGSSGDDGPATIAQLYNPYDVAIDPNNGNVYIADSQNRKIRVVQQVCPPGSYMGGSTCYLCSAGTYNPSNNTASACITCPGSSTSQNGATQCTTPGSPTFAPTSTPGSPVLPPVASPTFTPTYLPGSPTPPPTVGGAIITVQCVQTVTFTSTVDTNIFNSFFATSLQNLLPSGVKSVVISAWAFLTRRRVMRHQLRRLLTTGTGLLRLDYTVTSSSFTGVDTMTTFLQSANTLSQLTSVIQTAYPGATVSTPTVSALSTSSTPSTSSSSSSSSIVIIAAAAGGGGGLLLLGLGLYFYQRGRKAKAKKDQIHMDGNEPIQAQSQHQQLNATNDATLSMSTGAQKMNSTVGTTIGTTIAASNSMMTPKNVHPGGFSAVATDDGPVPQQSTLPIIDWMELMPSVRIGQGAFSAVYRGVWNRPGRAMGHDVALKVMTKSRCLHDYENALKLAREEAELMHRLCVHDHLTEHVTEVFGFCAGPIPLHLIKAVRLPEDDEGFCIVMRHYSGGTLEDLLSHHTLTMLEKLQLLTQIVSSLAELHAVGITHGDLKPANFLLVDTTSLSVRIADFGMSDAKQALDGTLGQSALHRTGGTKGTPIYCAPEMLVCDDDNSVMRHSRSTDIYAFAIILWQILSQQRPFDTVTNAATLGIKVHVQGERPPLSDLPADTPAPVITIMQQCWAGDRTQRLSAARCLAILAKELDVLEEQEAKKTGTVGENPLGKSMMARAPHLEEMIRMQMMMMMEMKSIIVSGNAEVKKGQELLLSGQQDLKEGQQEVLKAVRDLSEQLSRSLDGLGQSLTQLTAAAMRDEKVEHGVSALTSALEAHRVYLLSHGDASDATGTMLSQAINDAMTSLDPALASNLQRYIADVMSSSGVNNASGSNPSQTEKLDALMGVMRDMQGELRSVRQLANEQSDLLKVIEKRGNKMPHTFVILPDMGTEVNDTDASQLSMAGKIKSYLMRQKDKMMGLVWERSRLFFICPVTGQAVPCGPPTSPHNGKGYLIKVPTAMVRALAPALQWGVIFLKVALASQGLGGILPIPIDWLPGQLAIATDLTQLQSMVNDMDQTTALDNDVKKFVVWEQKEAKHDAVKQNAMARVYKFIAEAEGNADDILNPAWIPQHTGLILTTAKTTGASLWVSKEGQQAFEERGWDAVQKN